MLSTKPWSALQGLTRSIGRSIDTRHFERMDSQVFVYNKLVDIFPKHQLFYIIGAFYFTAFSAIAIALADPVIGVQNDAASPTRIIGEETPCEGGTSAWSRFGWLAVRTVYCAAHELPLMVTMCPSGYSLRLPDTLFIFVCSYDIRACREYRCLTLTLRRTSRRERNTKYISEFCICKIILNGTQLVRRRPPLRHAEKLVLLGGC